MDAAMERGSGGRMAGFIKGLITKLVPRLSPVYHSAAEGHGDVALFTAKPLHLLHPTPIAQAPFTSLHNKPPSLNLPSTPASFLLFFFFTASFFLLLLLFALS